MKQPTQKYLHSIFRYCPDTGFLYRRVATSNQVKVGDRAGFLNNGYISVSVLSKTYYAHRLIWMMHHGKWPKQQIDHINRVKHDNRLENLRDVSPSENQKNRDSYPCRLCL